jgi:S1-C subfamily serine protease
MRIIPLLLVASCLAVSMAPSGALAQKPPPLAPGEVSGAKPLPQGAVSGAKPLPGLRAAPPPEGRASASGTGFMVGEGRLLTNHHVVEGCARLSARNAAGQRVAAQVLATDPRRDLALLAVPAGFGPVLIFRDSPAVRRGETVVTYGFPLSGVLSSGPTLTTGDISALAGLRDNPLHFQISAPVQPGNSGGPLFDAQGHVVGVVVSKLNAARIAQMTGGDIPQNVNFAIKGPEAASFLAANHAPVQHSPSTGPDLKAAVIGDVANPSVMFLQCFK